MKNKALIILSTLMIASLSAQAQPTTSPKLSQCPFTDNFYIAGAVIQSLSNDGNVVTNQVSSTYFTDGCTSNNTANNGNIYLTVSSAKGICNLTIQDGAYMMNPIVASSSCKGTVQYTGMDHAFGTYDYTLKFN